MKRIYKLLFAFTLLLGAMNFTQVTVSASDKDIAAINTTIKSEKELELEVWNTFHDELVRLEGVGRSNWSKSDLEIWREYISYDVYDLDDVPAGRDFNEHTMLNMWHLDTYFSFGPSYTYYSVKPSIELTLNYIDKNEDVVVKTNELILKIYDMGPYSVKEKAISITSVLGFMAGGYLLNHYLKKKIDKNQED